MLSSVLVTRAHTARDKNVLFWAWSIFIWKNFLLPPTILLLSHLKLIPASHIVEIQWNTDSSSSSNHQPWERTPFTRLGLSELCPTWALNTSRDVALTTSLVSLLQWLTTLTAKNFARNNRLLWLERTRRDYWVQLLSVWPIPESSLWPWQRELRSFS